MIHLSSLFLARPFRGIAETVSSTLLVSREFAGQSSRKNLEPFDLIRLMAHRAQRSISPNTPERVVRTEDLDPIEARFAHRRTGTNCSMALQRISVISRLRLVTSSLRKIAWRCFFTIGKLKQASSAIS